MVSGFNSTDVCLKFGYNTTFTSEYLACQDFLTYLRGNNTYNPTYNATFVNVTQFITNSSTITKEVDFTDIETDVRYTIEHYNFLTTEEITKLITDSALVPQADFVAIVDKLVLRISTLEQNNNNPFSALSEDEVKQIVRDYNLPNILTTQDNNTKNSNNSLLYWLGGIILIVLIFDRLKRYISFPSKLSQPLNQKTPPVYAQPIPPQNEEYRSPVKSPISIVPLSTNHGPNTKTKPYTKETLHNKDLCGQGNEGEVRKLPSEEQPRQTETTP